MTNAKMTKEVQMSEAQKLPGTEGFLIRTLSFFRHLAFVIRHFGRRVHS